jgi:hypothetical protein
VSVTVNVQESWESDPILENPVEPSSFVTRTGAGLTYQGGGRRSTLSIGGEGGGVFYHDLPGYNSYYYGGNLLWRQRLNQRTSFSLIENVVNDYARRSGLLVEGGLIFSLVRAFTSRTDALLTHDFTPRTRLETSAGYDYVKFLEGDLLDGRQMRAAVTLSRRLNPRTSLGMSYVFNRSTKDLQPDQDVHSARAVWSKLFGRNHSWGASFGASALKRLDGTWSVSPTGNAYVNVAEPRTKLLMNLRYEHEVNQAFGLGVERIADVASFSLSRPIGRKLSGSASYGYSRSQDTGSDVVPFSFQSHNLNGGLRYAPTRDIGVDLGYSYFRTGYYTPIVNNHSFQLGLVYRRDPR